MDKRPRYSLVPWLANDVKVKFWKNAWWVFVNHHSRRRARKVGTRPAALAVKRDLDGGHGTEAVGGLWLLRELISWKRA